MGVGAALVAALIVGAVTARAAASRDLGEGDVAGTLGPGEAETIRLPLERGEYVFLAAEQWGVDLVLTVADPSGRQLARRDGGGGDRVPETFAFVSESAGDHLVTVTHSRGGAGRYVVTVGDRWPTRPGDAERIVAEAEVNDAQHLAALDDPAAKRQAIALFARSLERWRRLGDAWAEAFVRNEIGVAQDRLGDFTAALENYRVAARLWAGAGDRSREAGAIANIGNDLRVLGRLSEARDMLQRALPVLRDLGPRERVPSILNLLGIVFTRLGEADAAVATLKQAASEAERIDDLRVVGLAHLNLGTVAWNAGDALAALEAYERALPILERHGVAVEVPQTWLRVGLAQQRLGRPQAALAAFMRALDGFRATGHRPGEARILDLLGDFYEEIGEEERATSFYRSALPLFRAAGQEDEAAETQLALAAIAARTGGPVDLDGLRRAVATGEDRLAGVRRLEHLAAIHETAGDVPEALRALEAALPAASGSFLRARVLFHLGRLRGRQGSPTATGAAREELLAALLLARRLDLASLEVQTVAELARLELARGDLHRARTLVEQGLVTARRDSRPLPPELAGPWRSGERTLWELAVRLAVGEGEEPAREAFRVAEEVRGRGLAALLSRSATAVGGTLATAAFDGELSAQAAAWWQLVAERAPADEVAALEVRLQELLARREAAAAPADAAVAGLPEVAAALPEGTLLLEYLLGEEASFLWTVERTRWRVYRLPARGEIEGAVREVHGLLARRLSLTPADRPAADRRLEELLARLSRDLLAPARREVAAASRLVVVPDGALSYLPFAALPTPGGRGEPLVARTVVSHVPSATAYAALAGRSAPRLAADSRVAVFADPVTSRLDPRLAALRDRADTAAETPAVSPELRLGVPELPRLHFSAAEAAAIDRIAGSARTQLATGFAASRAGLAAMRLASGGVLHIAAHGRYDQRSPLASSLVLSLFDEAGRPHEGHLHLPDLAALELDAELVVLSGCSTALGREVAGEGLVGLTHGFFAAGARRVLASLWAVDDRSTAALMEAFYRALLVERLPPAEALAQAQRALLAGDRWDHPAHWAPFVLLGAG